MSILAHLSPQFDPNVEMDDSLAKNLRNTISGIKSEIAKLDVQDLPAPCSYSEATTAIPAMAQKEALLVSLKRYTKLLHLNHSNPIRRLPNEILAEIFVQVLYSLHPLASPDVDTPTFGDVSLAPLRQMRGRILRVCWRWRRTTISEPRLWQVVKLTIGSPSLEPEAWQHIQERIAWAGSLNFYLAVYHKKSSPSVNDNRAFKIFCGLLPRLLSLHVRLEKDLTIPPIQLDDPPEMYVNLKQICVEASREAGAETRGWCQNLLSNTPEVVWLELPTPDNMSFSPRVLSNLQFLRLGRAESHDVVTILDRAGRLLSLHVKFIPYSGLLSPGKTGIVQSQLSRLRIDVGGLSFLQCLTLPALRHLTFRAAGEWPTSHTEHFFDRSQCKLLTLEAQTYYTHIGSSISRIIETQETLTTLRFFPQDSYDTIAVPDAFIWCLAKLPRLSVCHFIINSIQIQALQRVLSARLKAQTAGNVVKMEDWVVTIVSRSYFDSNCDEFNGIVKKLSKIGSNLRVEDGQYASDSSDYDY